ncbi:family 20 glycosylhydrolase [Emticicia sp. BO119]|uniref:glycoside hydrolase family 20 protein n=1 Tax=Emticicia sp. BO119 TaxID=2757768 RepID=UPI0015F0F7E1|nr:family 20 glycosylhydrolase [Emticicia sp. BO119]MBA4851110.1 family 20 glycosylhydrolase [Emticicia sp. BO119]
MKKIFGLLSLLLILSVSTIAQNKYAIIPQPLELTPLAGEFTFDTQTKILIPKGAAGIRPLAEMLAERVEVTAGIKLPIEEADIPNSLIPANKTIVFAPLKEQVMNKMLGEEDYILKADAKGVILAGATGKGEFYALQSLLQLLPPQIFSSSPQKGVKWAVPACTIFDRPRYGHRGSMLDVARHFFPVSFVKRYIDLLALHKMNRFHWHLTDDQGWRIEIKKYPKLTEIGSKRKESMKGHYNDWKFDGTPHGGFYTQEEIKDVIAYAQKKFITIIPEIEMPGHALAALASYPELGCTEKSLKGGPYEVTGIWGVHDDVFCPTETTFRFLEDVLTEVVALFPSEYVHIGGDECPKTAWKQSKFCQDLMKKEGLKDEHELQSYFIKHFDKFLTSKGKKIIGWDEILEGGISPNATIMSWRGVEGGIAAAQQNHDAIMTPTGFCYLDYYQSDPSTEPLAIGGYLPLEKVYSYDPTPKALTPEQAKHILGIQANLWTEYIQTPDQVEYMAYPRACAIAETGWTSARLKNYDDFTARLKTHFERLKYLAVNYARSYYDITASSAMNDKSQVVVKLQSVDKAAVIRYTLDGSEPTADSPVYKPSGVVITKDGSVRAAAFSAKGEQLGKILTKYFFINKATGRKYTLVNQPKNYTGGETYGLTNGVKGEDANSATWVGFEGKDLDITIDLGQSMTINKVSFAFKGASDSWIMLPTEVEVFTSNDGKSFTSAKKIPMAATAPKGSSVQQLGVAVDGKKARYVRVFAKNYGKLPDNHPGNGNPAWLFVDEIAIE